MKRELIFIYLRILNIIWEKLGKVLGYEVFSKIYERARRNLIEKNPWILNLKLNDKGFFFKEIEEEEIDTENFEEVMEKLIEGIFTLISSLIGKEITERIQNEVEEVLERKNE